MQESSSSTAAASLDSAAVVWRDPEPSPPSVSAAAALLWPCRFAFCEEEPPPGEMPRRGRVRCRSAESVRKDAKTSCSHWKQPQEQQLTTPPTTPPPASSPSARSAPPRLCWTLWLFSDGSCLFADSSEAFSAAQSEEAELSLLAVFEDEAAELPAASRCPASLDSSPQLPRPPMASTRSLYFELVFSRCRLAFWTRRTRRS